MANIDGLNPAFRSKIDALVKASGGKITINSGYRSPEEQAKLWQNALKQYGSEEAARKYVAPPGKSNHGRGVAVDLGGDLDLARKLAPQFGLFFPMSWEPWHVEPMGARGDQDAYTTPPDGMQPKSAGPLGEFAQLLDSPSSTEGISKLEEVLGGGQDVAAGGAPSGGSFGTVPGGPEGLDAFMKSIGGQESGGNYGATNSGSGAHGKYQIMPSNWPSWSKEAGLPAGAAQTPENQERVARFKMQQYYNQFGSWDKVAKAWYSGPGNVNKNVGGGAGYPDSDSYSKQVVSRMG